MRPEERQKQIHELLMRSDTPVTGADMSKYFSVSRQIIIKDIEALRSNGVDIISTHSGYIISNPCTVRRVIKVHHTDDDIEKVLNTIVDMGGRVIDDFVKHRVYDEIRVPMKIFSRLDVKKFMEEINSGKSASLSNITSGYHYHTIEAQNSADMELILKELESLGLLAKFLDYESEESF